MRESREETKQRWLDEWEEITTIDQNASFIGKCLRALRFNVMRAMIRKWSIDAPAAVPLGESEVFPSPIRAYIDKFAPMIDAGCAVGDTVHLFVTQGFKDIVGIDISEIAIKECIRKYQAETSKLQLNWYVRDASQSKFEDNQFHLYFSEGLWEHFSDPKPFMDEAVRITERWILCCQPNQHSFFGWLLHWGWKHFGHGGIEEKPFPPSYYINYLESKGFKLVDRKASFLHEQPVLLFRRT